MQKSFLLLCFCCISSIFLQGQTDLNMKMLSQWTDPSLPVASPGNLNLRFSGCWGTVVNGREVAVVGGAADVFFFDVTVPASPQLLGKFPGGETTVWREFKSYKDRVYAVSDGTSEGMMIFDLSDVPNQITKTYDSTQYLERGHTITLDTTSGRIYINGGSAGNGIIVLDVSGNPDAPVLLGHPNLDIGDMGGYVHDSYVRNDTLYCSSGWEGYYVIDFKDPVNPKLVGSCQTGGYNHNSWVSKDGKYAYYTEEIPQGRPIRIVDLQNMAQGDIEVVGGFLDNLRFPTVPDSQKLAISHNVYIRDNLLFDSQYEDGLLVYNISEPEQPILVGHFDTHPQNTAYNGYFGNWGNYPWFPSGTIVATDMQNGVFFLKLSDAVYAKSPDDLVAIITPNPATNELVIRLDKLDGNNWSYRLLNMAGQLILEGSVADAFSHKISLPELPVGIYTLDIHVEKGGNIAKKIAIH
jgi:choice-of-anchor B domain-containing protein